MAIPYLFDQGYSGIACIIASLGKTFAHLRLQGFSQVMHRMGLTLAGSTISNLSGFSSGHAEMAVLPVLPRAVFTGHDASDYRF